MQVGIMTMGVVDIMMVGHYSGVALAAVALGNLYFFGATIFGWGVVMGLDPVIAQAVGAEDDLGVSRGLERGCSWPLSSPSSQPPSSSRSRPSCTGWLSRPK